MPASSDLLTRLLVAARRLRSPPVRLFLFALLALFAAWPLLATAPLLNDFRDAHVLSHYEQVAVDTVLRHHQVPLWDPFYCGGMYLLGTPQARFASPPFVLSLLFGEARGEALAVFVMLVIGLEGAMRYARSYRATTLASTLAAPVFALSGVFAVSPSLGWINFFGFELLPWAALGVKVALRGDPRGVAVAAGALAFCVGFGGTYAAPMAALWCGYEVVAALLPRIRRRRGARAVLGMAAVTACLTLALSAFRLWPVWDTLRAAPRVIGGAPGTSVRVLLRMLFWLNSSSTDNSDDGTYFIGLLAVPALLLGALRKRALLLDCFVYLSGWLAAGYGVHPSLFAGLRGLPIYETLRYPERYLIFVALGGCVLVARGVTIAQAWARAKRPNVKKRGRRALPWLVLALFANTVVMVLLHRGFDAGRDMEPPPGTELRDRPFHQARGIRWSLAYYEPMNRGSLSCWEAYPVPESPALRGDLAQEEWLADAEAGTLRETAWSPNRIALDVTLARPARVLVNQNWHGGWHANVGTVASDHGLLAVDLPEGHHEVVLRYLPRSAWGGALVSLLAALAIAAGFVRRRPLDLLGEALAPGVVLAILLATTHEPFVHAEWRAPDGSPIVVDAPAPDARRIGATLEGGITLEAAKVPKRAKAGAEVVLELDWRRGKDIKTGLGVFVHLEPSKGEAFTGDHVLLSGVFDFEHAPPDKTLRDLLPLHIPDDAAGTHWRLMLGLWRVRGAGERMKVTSNGAAKVVEDRILAAEFDVK